MASGLPVVSTDVGDVATMVAAENRRFVVAPDDSAMASALALLTADLVVRREIGAANLAKARAEFGQAAMFDAYGALWRG
jgi:glycosyltransferase involved in cell wall biosynthesis